MVEVRNYLGTINTTIFNHPCPQNSSLPDGFILTNYLCFTGSLSKSPCGHLTAGYKSIIKMCFLAMEKDACENSHQTSEEPHHIRVFPRNYGKLWGQVGKKNQPQTKPQAAHHSKAKSWQAQCDIWGDSCF